jgi:hypothetical protein
MQVESHLYSVRICPSATLSTKNLTQTARYWIQESALRDRHVKVVDLKLQDNVWNKISDFFINY